MRRRRADRIAQRALFDVRMEGVVHQLATGVIDRLDEANIIGDRRQEVTLEAIEVLDAERDTDSRRVLCRLSHTVHSPLEFILRGAATAEDADGRVVRTDQVLRFHGRAAVEGQLVVGDTCGPCRVIRTDRIVFFVADGNCRAFESELIEFLAELFIDGELEVEDRHLNSVVAELLELLENGIIFLDDLS